MEPHRPKGQASLFDLGTKRKRTEDDGPARELIIRLRPDVQQTVAGRGGRTHSARARGRGRGRGRGLETLEISETSTEEDEGEEEGGEAMQE